MEELVLMHQMIERLEKSIETVREQIRDEDVAGETLEVFENRPSLSQQIGR